MPLSTPVTVGIPLPSPPSLLNKGIGGKTPGSTNGIEALYIPSPDNSGEMIELLSGVTASLKKYPINSNIAAWTFLPADLLAGSLWMSQTFWDIDDLKFYIVVSANPAVAGSLLVSIDLAGNKVVEGTFGTNMPSGFGGFSTNTTLEKLTNGNFYMHTGTNPIAEMEFTKAGAIISSSNPVLVNGVNLPISGGKYRTKDTRIWCGMTGVQSAGVAQTFNFGQGITISRGGRTAIHILEGLNYPGISTVTNPSWIIIGNEVHMYGNSGNIIGPHVFDRTSFDGWLKKIANYLGLPN